MHHESVFHLFFYVTIHVSSVQILEKVRCQTTCRHSRILKICIGKMGNEQYF